MHKARQVNFEIMIRKRIAFIFYLFFLFFLDQITKIFLANRDFFVGFIHFHTLQNRGLSFGINLGDKFNFLILTVAIVLFLVYLTKNFKFTKTGFWMFLIFTGAASNLVDRFYFGFVRDFIDLRMGFTFNLADLYILIGLVALMFSHNQVE